MASAHLGTCKGGVGSPALWFGLKGQKCTLSPIILPLTLVMQPEILPLEICYFSFESLFFHKSFVKWEELTF